MNDGWALLRGIEAEPWSDVPRLAYADWLEENGNSARAEFIRLQVARRDGPPTAREAELLAAHQAEWVAELGCSLLQQRFTRGFLNPVWFFSWGLVDAVMLLVAVKTEKRRNRVLLTKLHGSSDHAAGRAAVADELPGAMARSLGEDGLEMLRQRLAATPPSLTSRLMVCCRSPLATAEMVRVTSVVGHSRSSISVLTEDSIAPQAPERRSLATRWRVLPSLPTTWPTCSSCWAKCWLVETISLKVSAILPSRPGASPAIRTEKSPMRMACKARSRC